MPDKKYTVRLQDNILAWISKSPFLRFDELFLQALGQRVEYLAKPF
jgi:hypothetical protein